MTVRLRWYCDRMVRTAQFRGVPYTLLWCLMFALKQAPRKWFLSYRTRQFDRRFGLDTAGTIELDALGVTSTKAHLCNPYEPCTPEIISSILSTLPIRFQEYTFVDLGAGKAVGLLVASTFAFKRIVGVEWSEQLVRIARENVRKFRSCWQKCRDIEVIHGDATTYELPNEPLVIYVFNTFHAEIMRQVLENLGNSLSQCPRHVVVVYYNPVCKPVFDDIQFLRLIASREVSYPVAIYETTRVAPKRAEESVERVSEIVVLSQ